jgi:hypothetical protein
METQRRKGFARIFKKFGTKSALLGCGPFKRSESFTFFNLLFRLLVVEKQ